MTDSKPWRSDPVTALKSPRIFTPLKSKDQGLSFLLLTVWVYE